MNNKLINYFLKITHLTTDEIKVLTESMIIKKYAKGSFLVQEGQLNKDSYFVLEGCVRQFKLVDGNDITTHFYTEEQWIISPGNLETNTVAKHSLVCVEDATVVIGNEQKARELFEKYPRFETISRQIMERAFLEQQQLMTTYITDKPEQRYLKLLESRPDIFQRVPQYDIATYIGVKPESLSRIRKKLHKKT
jgi:CRP-like cAMP-binding protein